MPLTTGSIYSGAPVDAGADPLVFTGKVSETLSAHIGMKLFDTWMLSRVMRLPAASAIKHNRITTYEASSIQSEAEATTETKMQFAQDRVVLKSFRTQQTLTAELIADSNAMAVVTAALVGDLQEKVCTEIGAAIALASYDAAAASGAGAYRDNVNTNVVTNGVPTILGLSQLAFGSVAAAGGLALGARFNAAQRGSLCFLMQGDTITQFVGTVLISNLGGLYSIVDGHPAYLGIPMIQTKGMLANALLSKGGLHIACVDLSQVLLAEQALSVSIDTESGIENNLVTIHAVYRAAAILTDRSHATGMTLRTMTSPD